MFERKRFVKLVTVRLDNNSVVIFLVSWLKVRPFGSIMPIESMPVFGSTAIQCGASLLTFPTTNSRPTPNMAMVQRSLKMSSNTSETWCGQWQLVSRCSGRMWWYLRTTWCSTQGWTSQANGNCWSQFWKKKRSRRVRAAIKLQGSSFADGSFETYLNWSSLRRKQFSVFSPTGSCVFNK